MTTTDKSASPVINDPNWEEITENEFYRDSIVPNARTYVRSGKEHFYKYVPKEGKQDKDVAEQPAYDDHMTRQLLVQIMPTATLSELEEKRAWVEGLVSPITRIRQVLKQAEGKDVHIAVGVLQQVSQIVGMDS